MASEDEHQGEYEDEDENEHQAARCCVDMRMRC